MVIEDYNYNDFPAVAFAARIDGRDQDTFVRTTIIPPSFRLSIKGSTRTLKRDCTIIGLGIMTRRRGVISAKTR